MNNHHHMTSLGFAQSKMAQTTIKTPTVEQNNKINTIKKDGYIWDEVASIQSAGVVIKKGADLWFFGLDGSILHNPQI